MQLLIELDPELAARLERVAPARGRKRSAFVREAIARALDALAEEEMRAAYRAQPDNSDTAYLDIAAWERDNPWRASEAGQRAYGSSEGEGQDLGNAKKAKPSRGKPARGRKRP